ncbi:solute carrier family 35, member C2 [Nematocida sp. AWRm77]|nr:solute carrier family 35, member C2 [Nematocida sp. AWRm77]
MAEVKEFLKTGACVGVFYFMSLGMSFFSSFILSKTEYNFSFPLFLSACGNVIHFLLSLAAIFLTQTGRTPQEQKLSSPIPYIIREKIGSPAEAHEKTHTVLRRREEHAWHKKAYFFFKSIGTFDIWIILCSLNGSIDIGFSGYSLRSVPLAFYTMLKSSTPIFILFSRFLFQLEKPSAPLALIIFSIALGVFYTSKNDSVVYNPVHIGMILGSSMMAGIRWAFLEYFIKSSVKQSNSVLSSLCVMSLLTGLFLVLGFFLFEGVSNFVSFEGFLTVQSTCICACLILGGAVVSFFLCLAEYILIARTSVITLSVIGIVKEIMIVCISVRKGLIVLSGQNIAGLALASVGILLFTFRDLLFGIPPAPQERAPSKEEEEEELLEETLDSVSSISSIDQPSPLPFEAQG